MKKLYILISCMVFSIMACFISQNVYAAAGKTTISVGQITAESEESITVPVKIEGNSGICAASMGISYDDELTLISISSGTAFSSLSMTKPGDLKANPFTLVWDGLESDASDGEIAILTFSNPGKAGTYQISISSEEGNIIDSEYNPVNVEFVNGNITVKDSETEKQEADQKKADEATKIINSMNAADKDSVAAARNAFDGLTLDQKNLVSAETLKKLTDAEEAIEKAEKEAEEKEKADKAALQAVENALAKLSPDDRKTVESARKLYDALDPELRGKVKPDLLKKLEDAEETIKKAEKEAEEKAKEDKKEAQEVENVILNLDSNDKEGIRSAREAYEALTPDQKKLVDSGIYKALTDAEEAIEKAEKEAEEKAKSDKAKADAVEKAFNEMQPDDRNSVEAARKAYEALTPEQKDEVSPLILKELIDAEESFKKTDQERADQIMTKIQSLNTSDESAVQEARTAYNALTNEQKTLVKAELLKKLTDAEALIKAKSEALRKANEAEAVKAVKLKADKVAADKVKNLITNIIDYDDSSINAAQKAYDSLTKDQKALIDNKTLARLNSAVQDLKDYYDNVLTSQIKVSGISHKIAAGKKIRLTASVLPNDAADSPLKWTSSNKKVATVNQNGIVTIKKKTGGKTVIITAAATDGSGKKAQWKIKVMKGVVKKLAVKGAKTTLKPGKIMKLKATVKATKGANKKLQWTSSNKKYATVNSKGIVKALKKGKGKSVSITVMATDGSNVKKVVKFKIK